MRVITKLIDDGQYRQGDKFHTVELVSEDIERGEVTLTIGTTEKVKIRVPINFLPTLSSVADRFWKESVRLSNNMKR